ncbi:MAG: hypothetical protein ABI165_07760, partial [Bryobacteraceae bacterium]
MLFRAPLGALARLAFHDGRYTYVAAIPFISLGLIWLNRRSIFVIARYHTGAGLAFVIGGLTLFAVTIMTPHLTPENNLPIGILAVIVV